MTALGPNVGMFRSRTVLDVLRPRTVDEVRELVGRSRSLNVFSTGRNWGLGSREPVDDGTVVLDLSDLDRIRSLDAERGFAVVEPGVTQGHLAARLAGTSRMLNVTAASAHTSIVGNALDRGVGLRHQRVDDLLGLEVVLPSGELLHVGWWPGADRPLYPHGVGPSLTQFFVQSSFGVVTAAAIRLLPRPEALRVLRLDFLASALVPAVDALRRWCAQGLVRGVLKVFDPAAAGPYGGSGFVAHVCVDGTAAAVSALTAVLTDEARAVRSLHRGVH